MRRIVLIAGFESFNAGLYRQAAQIAMSRCPDLNIYVFSDRALLDRSHEVAEALQGADVFFGSLLFDYDQIMWLRERVQAVPIRLVFESALELMNLTRLGAFSIADRPQGIPKPVKFILEKLSNSREEDKLAGYLSFLKVGPKLLKYVPVQKVQDLRNWLIIYSYWNAGGLENVASLFGLLAESYLGLVVAEIPPPVETPAIGLLHPDYRNPEDPYFSSPKRYLEWYHQAKPATQSWPVVGILLYRKHVITQQPYIAKLICEFETAGLVPVPIFINGVEGHVAVRDLMTTEHEQVQRQQGNVEIRSLSREAVQVDAILSTIGFPLVGGPAGSMEAGRQVEVAKQILTAKNIPYVVAAPLLIQDVHSWTRHGVGGLQSVVLYALPELDGAIDSIPLGGLVGEQIYLVPERVRRLTRRLHKWIVLRRKPVSERKIGIVLYGFPPGYGAAGTAALLNVPRSLIAVLQALQDQGYQVGELPQDGEILIEYIRQADQAYASRPDLPITTVSTQTLDTWLGPLRRRWIEKQWGSLTSTGIKTFNGEFLLGGVRLGNVWIGVQPPLGITGDPMRLMFERDMTPHPQYAAFYLWMQREFQADAVIHFGMHGTVEWLPGSPLGNTGYSWSDFLLGDLPNLYIYAANNPSESMLAKRRGYGVLISHNVPPYGRAGLYKELASLRELIAEYRENPSRNYALREAIAKQILDAGLERDCPFHDPRGIELTPDNIRYVESETFSDYVGHLYTYLQVLEERLFSCGLHTLGQVPDEEILRGYLQAYLGSDLSEDSLKAVIHRQEKQYLQGHPELNGSGEILSRAIQVRGLLDQTSDEIIHLLQGLNGEYIPPAPGGDLLRDGPGVLPTGRNIHALDPYRMPSPGAYTRGRAVAHQIMTQHLQETGDYPETVAVMLWGLDAIKTRGESLGILLELVGAEPIKEETGRIVRFELIPLDQLDHPRIDVLASMSGIFRDSFANIIDLLDDLFLRAAQSGESEDRNFIRKHARDLEQQGIQQSHARLFSNPAGDFGSLVNDRVVDSSWESGDELGQTWQSRNRYSYGRNDKGQARPEVLQALLKSTHQILQEIDSVEYGLTDIQEYYANTGALKRAAEMHQDRQVQARFVESFSQDSTPRSLEDLLRIEYRTKLLNPKWAEAMAAQGSGGVYEISQRMTALVGWGGTTDFKEEWVYDQVAQTYALDPEMARKLREANPEAFRNIVGRMLEASGRGLWHAEQEMVDRLNDLYDLADEEIEGIDEKRSSIY